MAKKEIDITKTGPAGFRQLQAANNLEEETYSPEVQDFLDRRKQRLANTTLYNPYADTEWTMESSLSAGSADRVTGDDYWGQSMWDSPTATAQQYQQLGDVRAENQPWYAQISAGIGKGVLTAVTTAAETAGLLYGVGQGIYNASTNAHGLGMGSEFLNGLWDNPITNALQKINDVSEELMPNYYTQYEQEHTVFNANFIGDKIIKNMGFMVGVYYGGIPAASLIGKIGTSVVKARRAAALMERAGMADRAAEIMQQAGKNTALAKKMLAAEKLTDADRAARWLKATDKVTSAAQTTRSTAQVLGVVGSAVSEGAIEAINNSRDWYNLAVAKEQDQYQQELQQAESMPDSPEKQQLLQALNKKHQDQLNKIEQGRVDMGNMDLLLNLPVLIASNALQYAKLYSRGFDSSRRMMGTWSSGYSLKGSLKNSTLKSPRSRIGAAFNALGKSNFEGLEEYFQRAASDGAGNAVDAALERYRESGKSEESRAEVADYISQFGQSVVNNLQDHGAREEYLVGFLSSMIGMPVFGSQTKNAYIGKGKAFGLAGGLYGNYKDYTDAMDQENKLATYLNERVKDPKFKALYDNLRKRSDFEKYLQGALNDNEKKEFKDLQFEQLFNDINAAASSGHLAEFKEMIGYNKDYTDEELSNIVKLTTSVTTATQQKKQDIDRAGYIEQMLDSDHSGKDNEELEAEYYAIQERLKKDDYKDKYEGPYVSTVNGQMIGMDASEEGRKKMRGLLEENKNKLLQSIDDYLKIRDNIDIETDGQLTDDQISELTFMRMKIQDADIRSDEMTKQLLEGIPDLKYNIENLQKKQQNELGRQKVFLQRSEEAVRKNPSEENKKELEEQKKTVKKAESQLQGVNNLLKMLEFLDETQDTSLLERMSYLKGYYGNNYKRLLTDLGHFDLSNSTEKTLNSDELQGIMQNLSTFMALQSVIQNSTNIGAQQKEKLSSALYDLWRLGHEKKEYNKRLRKFLGDSSLLQGEEAEREKKRIKDKVEETANSLSEQIKTVHTMTELENILSPIRQQSPEVEQMAMRSAMETADPSTKEFLKEYQEATNFYDTILAFTNDYPREIAASIREQLTQLWPIILEDASDVRKKDLLISELEKSAKNMIADGASLPKSVGEAINEILSNIQNTTSINSKRTGKKRKTSSSKKKKSDEEKEEKKKDDEEKNEEEDDDDEDGTETREEDDEEEKKEDYIKQRKRLLQNWQRQVKKKIEVNKEMPLSLEDLGGYYNTIKKFNAEHNDQQITEAELWNIIQEEWDKYSADKYKEQGEESDAGTSITDNNISKEMQERQATHITSGSLTRYRIWDDDGMLQTEKVPFTPEEGSQDEAIQQVLNDAGAFDFIDHNFLGRLMQHSEDGAITIHYLMSTDDNVNREDAPIFLAIKWDSKTKSSYPPTTVVPGSPVTINGEQYRIIGVAGTSSTATDSTKQSLSNLKNLVHNELSETVKSEQEKGNTKGFVVSTHTNHIAHINTGRLELSKNGQDISERISLRTMFADTTDHRNGNMALGVVVNGELKTEKDSLSYKINGEWLDKHNGAIVLLVLRPDGQYYPISVIRPSISMDKKYMGLTIPEIYKALKERSLHNGYWKQIYELFNTLLDKNTDIGKRIHAKTELGKFFIFGRYNPFHIDEDSVMCKIGDEEVELDMDNIEESWNTFFQMMADANKQFTVPQTMDLLSVIESDCFETNVKGYYNFNANFDINPIDAEGNEISLSGTSSESSFHNPAIRGDNVELNFGDRQETYILDNDTGKVYDEKTGKIVEDEDKENLVKFVHNAHAKKNGVQTLFEYLRNTYGSMYGTLGTITNQKGEEIDTNKELEKLFPTVYIYKDGDTVWLYDDKDHKITKDPKQIEAYTDKIDEAINNYVQEKLSAMSSKQKKRKREEKEEKKEGEEQEPAEQEKKEEPAKKEKEKKKEEQRHNLSETFDTTAFWKIKLPTERIKEIKSYPVLLFIHQGYCDASDGLKRTIQKVFNSMVETLSEDELRDESIIKGRNSKTMTKSEWKEFLNNHCK